MHEFLICSSRLLVVIAYCELCGTWRNKNNNFIFRLVYKLNPTQSYLRSTVNCVMSHINYE